tara:strand:+ start:1401 stop:2450 length:1050 start_codon:yes stop_codon:yes gene_type:complete
VTDTQEIVIRSEQDAYDTLKLATIEGGLPDHVEIRFEGWPTLEILVKGEGYNGTITPSIMHGFIEFQKAIYRTFALTRYNSVNINKLTKDDKDALELWIKVDEGSSLFSVDFQQLLERFVDRVGDKVTPKSLVIIALIVAAGYVGDSSFKSYVENRRLTRIAELESQERIAELEERQYADRLDVERMQILADATRDEPRAANIREYADEARLGVMKSLRGSEEASVAGVTLDGEVATELTKNARREAHEVRLDGLYRVHVVDSSVPDVFKIRVRNIENGESFVAIVQDETLENRHKRLIQQAEWAKTPVFMSINAREVGGEIRKAVVLGAEQAPDTDNRLPAPDDSSTS